MPARFKYLQRGTKLLNWAALITLVAVGVGMLIGSVIGDQIFAGNVENAKKQLADNPNSDQALSNLETAYRIHGQIETLRYLGIASIAIGVILGIKL